jgi:hypothetical protein
MKKLLFILPILAIATLILSGCTDNSIQCTEEQKSAEICTMEYMPVCGNDDITYGNACGACSAEGVDSYVEGECPTVEEVCGPEDEVCAIPEVE